MNQQFSPFRHGSTHMSVENEMEAFFSFNDPEIQKRFLLLAETFQALGDSSRVQIVWLLSKSEHNVGEIAKQLSMSQPAVSHHLRTLRNLKLVKVRREGRTSFYSLDDFHIERLLQEGIKHVLELT